MAGTDEKSGLTSMLIRATLARGISSLGVVVLVVVLGRLYGPAGVGVFALAQSFLVGGGIIACFGMDNALMRFVGRDPTVSHVMIYLKWASLRSMQIGLIVSLIVYFSRSFFEQFFSAEGLGVVLAGVAIAIPALTMSFLLSGFFKGVRKPGTACLLENGAISLVAAIIIYLSDSLEVVSGLNAVGWGIGIAAWLVTLMGGVKVYQWVKKQRWVNHSENFPTSVTPNDFMTCSRDFFIMSFATFGQTVLGVLIAGWFLSSSELGLFKSAQQMAGLTGFVLIVINAIFPARFASLHYEGKHAALGTLARQGALLGIVLAAPLLLICLVFPHWLLGLFGTDFYGAEVLLRIVAVAQLINVATGSVAFLLNMTGHESLMRNIAVCCNILGMLMFLLLVPWLGALGAALALAFLIILQNLVALVFVWRCLGIWTLPLPNPFKMLSI